MPTRRELSILDRGRVLAWLNDGVKNGYIIEKKEEKKASFIITYGFRCLYFSAQGSGVPQLDVTSIYH